MISTHPSREAEVLQVHLVGDTARRVDGEGTITRLRGEEPCGRVEQRTAHQHEPLPLEAPRVHSGLAHELHLFIHSSQLLHQHFTSILRVFTVFKRTRENGGMCLLFLMQLHEQRKKKVGFVVETHDIHIRYTFFGYSLLEQSEEKNWCGYGEKKNYVPVRAWYVQKNSIQLCYRPP